MRVGLLRRRKLGHLIVRVLVRVIKVLPVSLGGLFCLIFLLILACSRWLGAESWEIVGVEASNRDWSLLLGELGPLVGVAVRSVLLRVVASLRAALVLYELTLLATA